MENFIFCAVKNVQEQEVFLIRTYFPFLSFIQDQPSENKLTICFSDFKPNTKQKLYLVLLPIKNRMSKTNIFQAFFHAFLRSLRKLIIKRLKDTRELGLVMYL